MKNRSVYLTDEDYKFVFSRVPRLCLDFVIIKDNSVLLSKRAIDPYSGYWHLPGGMVRLGESIEEASERIIKSELGVDILDKKLVGFMEFPDEVNKNGLHIHSVSLAFLTKLADGKIGGSDQSEKVELFKILPEKMHPVHGKFLQNNWKDFIK